MNDHRPAFERYIGIDYSGAQSPDKSLKGLCAYTADRSSSPVELPPPSSPRKYWTRKGLAQWLVEIFRENVPIIVGIDNSFSFPIRYFETHHILPDWQTFLDDFQAHWPTDSDYTYVDFVRNGSCGNGEKRWGRTHWRRFTEERAGAKSVFHFDVPGSAAKSTHAGLPWLRYLRQEVGDRIHCWPFDGWDVPLRCSTLVEVYPSLWSKSFPREGRTPDQHDSYTVAAWLREADLSGKLQTHFHPQLHFQERAIAEDVEGWILGVM